MVKNINEMKQKKRCWPAKEEKLEEKERRRKENLMYERFPEFVNESESVRHKAKMLNWGRKLYF